MKLIIPMAGRGTRLRPTTLTTPKPLVKVAGKPIVQRIVEDFQAQIAVDEVVFIVGNFGAEVESQLRFIAQHCGVKCQIVYQTEPLGIAHALLCAEQYLQGEVYIAFADTLFDTQNLYTGGAKEAVIWVKEVNNPQSFGIVETDHTGKITRFEEKPTNPKSKLAITGIYYFRNARSLVEECSHVVCTRQKQKG